MSDPLDLVIVGAGPAGIALGAEAVTAGVAPEKILVLERGDAHSWSIRKYYPDAKLVTANYKGLPAVCSGVLCLTDSSKHETLTYLDRAIADHGLVVRYNEGVCAIRPRDGHFLVETTKAAVRTRTCAIAIGILGRPQKPDWQILPALKARITFDVTSVSLKDADVLVVGGGDSASEYVQYLVQEGCRVVLAYRGDSFHRMNDINRDSLLSLGSRGRATILRKTDVERVECVDGRPRVHFAAPAAEPRTFDHVVLALGGTTPENFLRTIGIDFDGAAPVLRDGYETSIPGLFLVGDLTAGRTGGSIVTAFNSANEAMRALCDGHLDCRVPRRPPAVPGGR
jgi:thioredoxin reductase (NADPH)